MTTPNDLAALAARMQEAQVEEQRELLIEAAKVLRPEWYEMSKPVEAIIAFTKWCRMLEAEAFESAALMLTPEGWVVMATNVGGDHPTTPDFSKATALVGKGTREAIGDAEPIEASTMALAIASAALLAHVEISHD